MMYMFCFLKWKMSHQAKKLFCPGVTTLIFQICHFMKNMILFWISHLATSHSRIQNSIFRKLNLLPTYLFNFLIRINSGILFLAYSLISLGFFNPNPETIKNTKSKVKLKSEQISVVFFLASDKVLILACWTI
jgi:hypothetical protein